MTTRSSASGAEGAGVPGGSAWNSELRRFRPRDTVGPETALGQDHADRSAALLRDVERLGAADDPDAHAAVIASFGAYLTLLNARRPGALVAAGPSAEIHATMWAHWPLSGDGHGAEARSGDDVAAFGPFGGPQSGDELDAASARLGADPRPNPRALTPADAFRHGVRAINALHARAFLRYDRDVEPSYATVWRETVLGSGADGDRVRYEPEFLRERLWPELCRAFGADDAGTALRHTLLDAIALLYEGLGYAVPGGAAVFEREFAGAPDRPFERPLHESEHVLLAARARCSPPLPAVTFPRDTLLFWAANDPFVLDCFLRWGWLELADFSSSRQLVGAEDVRELLDAEWMAPSTSQATAWISQGGVRVEADGDPQLVDGGVTSEVRLGSRLSFFVVGEARTGKTSFFLSLGRRLLDGSESRDHGVLRNVGQGFRAAFDSTLERRRAGEVYSAPLGPLEIEVQHPVSIQAFAQRVRTLDYPGVEIEPAPRDEFEAPTPTSSPTSPFDAGVPQVASEPDAPAVVRAELRRASAEVAARFAAANGLVFLLDGRDFAVENETEFHRGRQAARLQWYANVLSAFRAARPSTLHIPVAVVLTHADEFLHGSAAWGDDERVIGPPDEVDRRKLWDEANENPVRAFEQLERAMRERMANNRQLSRQRAVRRLLECGRPLLTAVQSLTFRYEIFLSGCSDQLERPFGAMEAAEWVAAGMYDVWLRDVQRLTARLTAHWDAAARDVTSARDRAEALRTAALEMADLQVQAVQRLKELEASRASERARLFPPGRSEEFVRVELAWWRQKRDRVVELDARIGFTGIGSGAEKAERAVLDNEVRARLGDASAETERLDLRVVIESRVNELTTTLEQAAALERKELPEEFSASRFKEHELLATEQAGLAEGQLETALARACGARPELSGRDLLARGESMIAHIDSCRQALAPFRSTLDRVMIARGLTSPNDGDAAGEPPTGSEA